VTGAPAGWPYPRCLAHRGGGTLAPENTLAAIRIGVSYGYRAFECDAMLAADGIAVLMHDPTLERTTNGRGAVDASTARQLGALDAGSWHGARFRGEPVPTLDAALALTRGAGIWANVEIKPAPGHDAATGSVVARTVLQHYPEGAAGDAGHAAPLLSSFSVAALEAARVAAPQLRRGLLVDRLPSDWRRQLASLQCVSLHCNHRAVDAALVAEIKQAGYWMLCYTVNQPERAAQMLAWGVDAICTDRIDLIGAEGPVAGS